MTSGNPDTLRSFTNGSDGGSARVRPDAFAPILGERVPATGASIPLRGVRRDCAALVGLHRRGTNAIGIGASAALAVPTGGRSGCRKARSTAGSLRPFFCAR